MRDRSAAMSVAVMMLRVAVLISFQTVVCMRGDVVAQDGYTALLAACSSGHIDVARWLVSEAGSDPRSERSNVRQRSCAAGLCS
jgi:hypothetical protein